MSDSMQRLSLGLVGVLWACQTALGLDKWTLDDVAPYIESNAISVIRINLNEASPNAIEDALSAVHKDAAVAWGKTLNEAGMTSLIVVVPKGEPLERYGLVPTGRNERQQKLANELSGNLSPIRKSLLVVRPLNDVIFIGTKPTYERIRKMEARRRNEKNLRQIALMIVNFESANGTLPPAASYRDGKPLLSWRVHVLPYLGQDAYRLHQQFNFNEPWDSEHNRKLIPQMPDVYRHPSDQVDNGKTVYLAPFGDEATFGPGETGTTIGQVLDGASKTISVVEAAPEFAVIWTKPSDWEYDLENPLEGLLGNRSEVAFAAIDVRIHRMTKQQAAKELRAWITKAFED